MAFGMPSTFATMRDLVAREVWPMAADQSAR
jgi:hypothetical protein